MIGRRMILFFATHVFARRNGCSWEAVLIPILSRLHDLSRCALKERRLASAWRFQTALPWNPGAAPPELRIAQEFGSYFFATDLFVIPLS
jgi:hypothetical protein